LPTFFFCCPLALRAAAAVAAVERDDEGAGRGVFLAARFFSFADTALALPPFLFLVTWLLAFLTLFFIDALFCS
jgi:hypothetical protein